MHASSAQLHLPDSLRVLPRMVGRAFPLPRTLFPNAAGIDISDASVKWLELETAGTGKKIGSWGEVALPEGAVVGGIIHDPHALAEVLAEVKRRVRAECVHAALPEEVAYVFRMHVPAASERAHTLSLIEFELEARVPIPPAAAVYDFSFIAADQNGEEIGVCVFPKEVAESYAAAFEMAGLKLLSLELEAHSIARAISGGEHDPVTLLVDFGRSRTGFAVLQRGVPIFTSTVSVGGENMANAVMEHMGVSREEALEYNNTQGLTPDAGTRSPGLEALSGTASALADEVARHYHYWDSRRNEHGERMTPVERVVLVGGASNLKGLADYIAGRVQAPTSIPNLWRKVAAFEDYIPPIDRRTSLQYATAIGLALRGQ